MVPHPASLARSPTARRFPRNRLGSALLAGAGLAAAALPLSTAGFAAEGATSFYIPGLKGPLAGFVPPPGFYFQNDAYFYRGRIGGGRTTAIGGNVVANVEQSTFVNFATPIWVTPLEVLGGNVAVSLTVPVGEPAVRAGAVISGPIIDRLVGRPLSLRARDATLNYGDPVLTGMVGWHAGNMHWSVGTSVSVPAGAYQPGQLSNVALNRWVGDFFGAVTYLDPVRGLELSAIGGLTLNGTNRDTDYRTGTELHLDVALSQYLSKELSVGVLASHYQQVTGDGGRADLLGPFKGRVTAIGGTLGYTFLVGQTPVSTRIKVLREIEVENRFQGTIGLLTVSLPIGGQAAPAPANAAPAKR
jgi:hypothetical protein